MPQDKDTERWPIPHMTGLSRVAMHDAIQDIDRRVRKFIARIRPDLELPPSIYRKR